MSVPRNLADLRKSAPGFLRRQVRHLGQVRYGWHHPRHLGFVFGCQRSGTKMVMRVLDESPVTRIYHENHDAAFHDFQLRPDSVLKALVRLSPAPCQVFKPICDSQEADHLLERFPTARGLWIYRHFDDVASSAVKKWGDHQLEVVATVAGGDLERWGWRTARLPESVVSTLRRLYRPDLSPTDGALLFWYMRNAFFFELGLDRHPRMLPIKYEDLARSPEDGFQRLFAWLRVPFDPGFVARVKADSIGRGPSADASPEIRALCQDLLERLDACAQAPRPLVDRLPERMLLLIDTLGLGGAERYTVTVANWFAARGVEVTVAARPGELVPYLDPRVSYVEAAIDGVRAQAPRASLEVRRIIESQRPDVIVTNSLATAWLARLAQARRRIPIVNVAHGWPAERYRKVGPLMRVADRVVAVSPEVKQKLVAAGLDSGRCAVVHNGVDLSNLGPRTGAARDAARADLGAGPRDLAIIAVGRLEAQKAQHHIIDLAARMKQRHPRLRWSIVGDGSREVELGALLHDRQVETELRLLGPRLDVAELLGSADIYINCSDWEGMPLTTIEAMASSLPIVATATEGSQALLTEDCGITLPPGDVDAMEAAIERLIQDPALRARMGVAARERAHSRFSHDRMCEGLAAVLCQVMA